MPRGYLHPLDARANILMLCDRPLAFQPVFEEARKRLQGEWRSQVAWLQVGRRDVIRLSSSARRKQRYTGFDVEPSLRLAWSPTSHSTLWAAVSDAVRQPDVEDLSVVANEGSMRVTPELSAEVTIYGNPKLKDEPVLDYEVGNPRNFGGEITVNWDAAKRWRISLSYSLLRFNPALTANSPDTAAFRPGIAGFDDGLSRPQRPQAGVRAARFRGTLLDPNQGGGFQPLQGSAIRA